MIGRKYVLKDGNEWKLFCPFKMSSPSANIPKEAVGAK